MIVSDPYKFIFVRVAKTGSTSFVHPQTGPIRASKVYTNQHPEWLRIQGLNQSGVNYGPIPRFVFENFDTPTEFCAHHGLDDWHHIPLFLSKKYLPPDKYNDYFKFGFVRNPFARMVSAYKYDRKFPTSPATKLSFKEWVPMTYEKHGVLGKYGLQSVYLDGCDFIGRVENLKDDYDYVLNHIDPELHKPLQKLNTTEGKKHYTEYYDEETKDIVSKFNKKDLEYFGYEFGE